MDILITFVIGLIVGGALTHFGYATAITEAKAELNIAEAKVKSLLAELKAKI